MSDVLSIIITILIYVLQAVVILIIVRFILSWVDPANNLRFSRFMRNLTEPMLQPARSLIPPLGFIDMSAIVALVLLQVFISLLNQLK